MKKSLITLAALGGFSALAAAQSSVTVFGIVDVNARYVKNDGYGSRSSLSSGGLNTSRLGFRGVEDLGGGLSAGFWLEGTLTPDDGNAAGMNWQRRATVSLVSTAFGEVRMGRDYTPTFLNYAIFDPFGVNGVGQLTNLARYVSPNGPNTVGQSTFIRASNSIGYFLPSLGGFYGQVMVAAGEGSAGKYVGGRFGYASGPVNVAAAYGWQGTNAASTNKYTTASVAGSLNLGFATLMAQYNDQKNDVPPVAAQKERLWLLGAVVPVGPGEIHASYSRSDAGGGAPGFSAADASQIAIGGVFNASKRSALYATASVISNKGSMAFSTAVGSASPGGPTAGGKSTGFEVGIRHLF